MAEASGSKTESWTGENIYTLYREHESLEKKVSILEDRIRKSENTLSLHSWFWKALFWIIAAIIVGILIPVVAKKINL